MLALPVAAVCPITLAASQRQRLKKAAFGHKTPHQARIRAQVVVHVARGHSNARIARETGLHLDSVVGGETGSPTAARQPWPTPDTRGAPARFTPVQVAETKALACQLPAETGIPLSR
ncbi:hypothetical protein [Streptomyces sp. NPDC050264]|uniref:hypothetical protein n=1 Tax=Streptomyces sp. NPDC050264 TaxID=3155038 RepID=UPI003425C5DD